MKYIIREGAPKGEYNASTKARNDVDAILCKLGYQPFYIKTLYGVQTQKWKKPLQFFTYRNNEGRWEKALKELKPGDEIVIQYPLINTTYHLEKFLKKCADKDIKAIALIHDMDSLRFTEEISGKRVADRVKKEDSAFLPAFDGIICHNESMKKILMANGIPEKKIVCLRIFDYLVDFTPLHHHSGDPVIIAGNLNIQKVQYLKYLDRIAYDFNLYGIGYEDIGCKNIHYQGAFKPEELLEHLKGSFGLVWDGESTDGCRGGWGDYLRYNNPHKASLYLAAGIPVIIWEKAALAEFIQNNQLGILISNLSDIENIKTMSSEEYAQLQKNAENISRYIQKGSFLENAIKQIHQKA